ncbi:MAG: amidophosphoribosyltransferase [Coriobacteriales bacterium]|jgi:amidophosphoribosyltransferase|nr:amidophosphoribosyltransferase [Coriobacteriales bacterium]
MTSCTNFANLDNPDRPDHPEEACGIFGIYAPGQDTARMTYFGLHALQHRGQESAGIAVGDGQSVLVYKDRGLVSQIFNESVLSSLEGNVAIGHVRYSTSGGSDSWESAQPHLSTIGESIIALAHNGTLVNSSELRSKLFEFGVTFRSTTDSELASKLIVYFTQKSHHMREGIRRTMELIRGAYSMVVITSEALYAFRDPHGIRPLSIGRLPDNQGWVVASETCGLDIVGAEFVRDVEPGEIIRINSEGLVAERAMDEQPRAFCVFEFVYFARPDSTINGLSVFKARSNMGRRLAEEAPADADMVIGVPDSGIPSAIGFAQASGIHYEEGIVKNRYVGRTFIQPTQALRQRGILLKLNPLPAVIAGKRLVLVDDSIVRGNTSRQLVQMLRDAGASEIHMRITSPPVVWPCFYGIDTDTQDQLIAASHDVQAISDFIGTDSLAFLSEEGLAASCPVNHPGFCMACFTGDYPVEPTEPMKSGAFCGGHKPHAWKEEQQSSLFSGGMDISELFDLEVQEGLHERQ